MLVALLETYLPAGYQLIAEFLLARQSQRVDIVVIRKVDVLQGPVKKLHSIFDYLRAHTLIEHKGPTDDLAAEDLLTLLGYAFQYMRIAKVTDPAELCLMVICDRIPPAFIRQVEKCSGELVEQADGLWQGKIGRFVLHGVETRDVYRQNRSERLLYAFSRAYLSHAAALLPMDPEEQEVYTWLHQQVEQFRRERGVMALKDFEALDKSFQQIVEEYMQKLPLEQRLRGLPHDQIASVLSPEERLRGLPHDQIASVLSPEERLRGLPPEERLQGLTPVELERLKRLLH
jgi:hypothetical protein